MIRAARCGRLRDPSSTSRGLVMGKSQDKQKRSERKKAQKSIKEKRAAKKAKKAEKERQI